MTDLQLILLIIAGFVLCIWLAHFAVQVAAIRRGSAGSVSFGPPALVATLLIAVVLL